MAMAVPNSSATEPSTSSFDILEDEQRSYLEPRSAQDIPTVLQELPVDHGRNEATSHHTVDVALAATFQKLRIASPTKENSCETRVYSRQQHHQSKESTKLEPLRTVDEEGGNVADDQLTVLASPHPNSKSEKSQPLPFTDVGLENHPLSSIVPHLPIGDQIQKHLAGQFEWLVSYAPPPSSFDYHSSGVHAAGGENDTVLFGCNLLSRQPKPRLDRAGVEISSQDVYTLIATPLRGNSQALPRFESSTEISDTHRLASPTLSYQTRTLQMEATVNEPVERTMSPALSVSDEETLTGFKADPISNSRIEDSLEELDKLEEELEAVNVVARPASLGPGATTKAVTVSSQIITNAKPTAPKRVSIAGPFPTIRIKPAERMNSTLRRSSSLTLRDKTSEGQKDVVEQKAAGSLVRSKSISLRTTGLQPTAKSTKAPTVPKFELPGEAVARRLKEQREARQAQQAETRKAQPPTPSKSTRLNKQLPKPTFELPGEAISRRKREEHEARLRAKEEEDRKKREFKARPIRHTIGPSTVPRETIASLARQGRLPQQESCQPAKRTPISGLKSLLGKTPGSETAANRGRNSIIVPVNDASRATSTSTGSLSGKKSNVSAEDAEKQRMRGRAIFTRDNSYTQQKEHERAIREAAAKRAREEAAERSRVASREWAEKKRRREMALK